MPGVLRSDVARPTRDIEDQSALNSARVDLGSRIGWMLRTWRMHRDLDLRALAELAGGAAAFSTLSRWEAAGVRRSAMIDGYERAMSLGYGALRAPIDTMCRTFVYAPEDGAPLPLRDSVSDFDAICAQVDDNPTGADWLRFAEAHASGPFGMPPRDLRPRVRRLAVEMSNSVGAGYRLRYEALARLRCSRYGDVVVAVAVELIEIPGVQRAADLVSAACEQGSPELLTWCGRLLIHDSDIVARAAAAGIQNICAVGGVDGNHWAWLVPLLVAAVHDLDVHPGRAGTLAATISVTPRPVRAAVEAAARGRMPTPARSTDWSPGRRNQDYARAMDLAHSLTSAVGPSAGSGLLARLVFEVVFDVRAAHAVTSAFLLAASPYGDEVTRQAVAMSRNHNGQRLALVADHALASMMPNTDFLDPIGVHGSPERIRLALRVEALAGRRPDVPATGLRELIRDRSMRGATLFALGMSADPLVAELAADSADPEVQRACRWWLDAGPRVSE